MQIKIIENRTGNPPGKLADAEIHFADNDGPLAGLKLVGFSIWERRIGTGRNVTFPSRQYAVNGERRSFALLRPIVDTTAQDRIRALILEAYAAYQESYEIPDDRHLANGLEKHAAVSTPAGRFNHDRTRDLAQDSDAARRAYAAGAGSGRLDSF